MARHRLVNCEFLNAGSFKVNVSNRAKLLYLMMIVSGDDRGFVDSTQDLSLQCMCKYSFRCILHYIHL